MRTFGDRWMAEGEIENIRQWESKNTLDSTLSNNYGSCLEFLFKMSLYMQAVGQAMEIRESILYSLLYRSSFLIVPIRLWRNYKSQRCLSFRFSILSFKKPGIAPFDVMPGFLFSSIPPPRGNRGYSGV